jgi:hypothetical protein
VPATSSLLPEVMPLRRTPDPRMPRRLDFLVRRAISSEKARILKRRRAGFSSGPLENKIFLPRCGAAASRLHTHTVTAFCISPTPTL